MSGFVNQLCVNFYLPQALQMTCPLPSRLQSGVMVVPQFWQAMMTDDRWFCAWRAFTSMGAGASDGGSSPPWHPPCLCSMLSFETRLLYAGQPLQPSAPPVPLQRPPPGQVPDGVFSAATYVAPATLGAVSWLEAPGFGGFARGGSAETTLGGFFRFVGRAEFLALK